MRATALVLSATLALGLVACSSDEPDSGSSPPTASAEDGSGGDSASEGSAAGGTAEGAGVEPFDPEQVLVEQVLESINEPGDAVTVAVTAMEVRDRVTYLELAVTPDRSSVSDSEPQSVFDLRDYLGTPSLLDRGNLKRYDVVRDGPNTYASDAFQTETVNGRAMRVYYYFAAPEDQVDAFDVVLNDSYPGFTDVPLSR